MTTECYDLVKEFHLKFGQPIFPSVTDAVRQLRVRLLLEELGETACAWHEHDRVGMADGLSDLLYVTAGAAVSCLELVHASDKPLDPWYLVAALKTVPMVKLATDVVNLCDGIHQAQNHKVLVHHLEKLMSTLQLVAYRHKIPLRDCFQEIHKSNMTKDVIQLGDGQKGGLKGPTYRPPNLAQFF